MMKPGMVMLFAGAAALAGCAAEPARYGYAASYGATPPSFTSDRLATRPPAWAVLPAEAGRVLAVRMTEYANGIRQEVVLDGAGATPGENAITLEALLPPGRPFEGARDDLLRVERPSVEALGGELARAFPGMPMTISPEERANPQGAFGFASGTSGSTSCLYAWQYVAPDRSLTLAEGALATGSYPYSVRLRLCRDLPVARLLSLASELAIHSLVVTGAETRPQPSSAAAGDPLDIALEQPRRSRAIETDDLSRATGRRPRNAPRHGLLYPAGARLNRLRNDLRTRPAGVGGGSTVPLPDEVRGGSFVPVPGAGASARVDDLPLPRLKTAP